MRFVSLGALTGALLVLSLPKPDWHPLAWFALVPLLFVLTQASSVRSAATVSYAAGFVFFSGTFYWMTETMIVYGGLDALSAFAVGLLFSVVYSFFFLAFGVGLYICLRRWGPQGLFMAAPLWVVIELIRTHFFFSGFPWMLTGYALVPYSGLLQIVTWTGIYGLSFVAAAANAGLAYGLVVVRTSPHGKGDSARATRAGKAREVKEHTDVSRRPAYSRSGVIALAATVVAILVLALLPGPDESQPEQPVDVRIVQTNIPLDQPWETPATDELLNELEEISARPGFSPQLVVWPETPAPFLLNEDAQFRERVQRIARRSGAHILLGYIDRIKESPSNSAALIDPEGRIVSRYDKIRLVPFGEYVPAKDLLFFAETFTRQVGDFAHGSDRTLSPINGHQFNTAICYESIFPDFVRRFVKDGSNLIVVITNDGWFGESSAPYQHLRMGIVRAVENRRYIVRSANTGISAVIDPYGRILAETPIGIRTVLEGTAGFRSDLTFYTRYGDVFAYLNVAVIAAALLLCFRKGAVHVRRTH